MTHPRRSRAKGEACSSTRVEDRLLQQPVKEPDLSLVTSALAEKMLDPESTRVSGVIGAPDATEPTLVWACGKVQGKNTFGGYAQPVPFIGSFVTNNVGEKLFLVVAISGPSNAEQLAVLNTCIERLK